MRIIINSYNVLGLILTVAQIEMKHDIVFLRIKIYQADYGW